MGKEFKPEKKASVRRPKFHNKGQAFIGHMLAEPFEQQATVYGTTDPKTYSDGRAVIDKVYDFLLVKEGPPCPDNCHYCTMSNERTDEDDGLRRIYANWIQHKVIQEAFVEAQKRDGKLQLYGQLLLTYADDDLANKKSGKAAPKIWKAQYINPTPEDEATVEKYLNPEPVEDDGNGKISFDHLISISQEGSN